MAPLCVKRMPFPLCECAPVLAAVKQSALDCGCGLALAWIGGNEPKNGSVGWVVCDGVGSLAAGRMSSSQVERAASSFGRTPGLTCFLPKDAAA
jgi:hypothetical protein